MIYDQYQSSSENCIVSCTVPHVTSGCKKAMEICGAAVKGAREPKLVPAGVCEREPVILTLYVNNK